MSTVNINTTDNTKNAVEILTELKENGTKIEIITLDELLALLGTTREDLESAPALDIDYLLDERFGKKAV